MKKRMLGRTGWKVSEIGLGAWAIGGAGEVLNYGAVTEADAFRVLEEYLAGGGNFIDTARRYNDSESRIGDFFAQRGGRESVYIASKTHRLERDLIRDELETTLRELRTDYVDLYFLHAPPESPQTMNRVLDIYEELKEEGLIRAIGASIKGPRATQETVDLCRQYIRTGRVDALEVIYSILRQRNGEMFQEARDAGVGIVVRTALESGFLTGKYEPGHRFPDTDHRHRWNPESLGRALAEAGRLQDELLSPPYETLAQVAIRFALARQEVSTMILGAKSPRQVRQNLATVALPPLRETTLQRLRREFGGRSEEFNP